MSRQGTRTKKKSMTVDVTDKQEETILHELYIQDLLDNDKIEGWIVKDIFKRARMDKDIIDQIKDDALVKFEDIKEYAIEGNALKIRLTPEQAELLEEEFKKLGEEHNYDENYIVPSDDLKEILNRCGITDYTIPNRGVTLADLYMILKLHLPKKKEIKIQKKHIVRAKPTEKKNDVKENFEDTDYLPDIEYFKKKLTAGEYRDLKIAFSYLDRDNSKTIKIDELQYELDKCRDVIKEQFPDVDIDNVCDRIMDRADKNKDEKIDLKEFMTIMTEKPITDLRTRANCNDLYKEFTENGKYDLNKKQLNKISKELIINDDDKTIEKMIFYADENADKKISEAEFYYILNPEEGQIEEMAIKWRDQNKDEEEEESSKGKKKKK